MLEPNNDKLEDFFRQAADMFFNVKSGKNWNPDLMRG